jgi:hypothetical protein
MRLWILAVGIAVAAVVFTSMFFDEGEVVTLVTKNVDGADFDTQLWIVQLDGHLYIRAGSPHARWLARLRENPLVTLKRGAEKTPFKAIPQDDPATLKAVNALMAEKYGYADRTLAYIVDRKHSVPILLEPRPGA